MKQIHSYPRFTSEETYERLFHFCPESHSQQRLDPLEQPRHFVSEFHVLKQQARNHWK